MGAKKRDKGETALLALYKIYQNSAIKRGLDFDLTLEEFKQFIFSNCYYCGVKPNLIFTRKRMNGDIKYNGIDRLANNSGYNKNNCVTCCKECNYAKHKMSEDDFYKWAVRLLNHAASKGIISLEDSKLKFDSKILDRIYDCM